MLARISHHVATAARDMPQSAAFSRLGVLDVLSSTTPRPSGRKRNISRHLTGLATRRGEKGGLGTGCWIRPPTQLGIGCCRPCGLAHPASSIQYLVSSPSASRSTGSSRPGCRGRQPTGSRRLHTASGPWSGSTRATRRCRRRHRRRCGSSWNGAACCLWEPRDLQYVHTILRASRRNIQRSGNQSV